MWHIEAVKSSKNVVETGGSYYCDYFSIDYWIWGVAIARKKRPAKSRTPLFTNGSKYPKFALPLIHIRQPLKPASSKSPEISSVKPVFLR